MVLLVLLILFSISLIVTYIYFIEQGVVFFKSSGIIGNINMIEEIDSEIKLTKKEEALVKKMAEAGVHFGHSKSRKNPHMDSYIHTLRNSVHIIDLVSTVKKLDEALKFVKETAKKGGIILFVGIQPQAKNITQEAAKECGMPYVVGRWLGGTLTNFKTIFKRVEYLLDLEKKKKSKELEKYTKKEQMLFDEQMEKLNRNLGGIKELNKLPDAIFVLSVRHCLAAVREAKRKKIPIIGLVDTDSDPALADYPIPANDDAISALKFMLEQVKDVILKNSPGGGTGKNDKS